MSGRPIYALFARFARRGGVFYPKRELAAGAHVTLDQITVYVGLGVIVFGAIIWAIKTSPGEENAFEVFRMKSRVDIRLKTSAIAVMAIGVLGVEVRGWLSPKAPLSNSELEHVSTAEQNRQEQVEIDRLASAKFDEADLRSLYRALSLEGADGFPCTYGA